MPWSPFAVVPTLFDCAVRGCALRQINWSLVVVDEGQRLKNRKAQALQALRDLHISRRLLLSGTPLQNNTAELWTLMNFVEPVGLPLFLVPPNKSALPWFPSIATHALLAP